MKLARADEIKKYILHKKKVSMNELYSKFDVSPNTIRRDLKHILQDSNIKKVYGGVVAVEDEIFIPFQKRKIINKKEKEKIGKLASQFVEDGDVIFIDSGTTTTEMIDGLKDKSITVITHNLDFINRALPYDNIKVVSLTGRLERRVNAFIGKSTVDALQHYNITKAFIATTGLSKKHGITNFSSAESPIKQMAIEKSENVFLLLDYTKFGKVGLITFSEVDVVDYVVTDKIDREYKEFFKIHQINIVY